MKIIEGLEKEYQEYAETQKADDYSYAVIEYLEYWANKMEEGLEQGKELKDIWHKASFGSDLGITGFQHGYAALLLSKYWVHGEELRKLHNTHHGQPDVKGTVNPAIFVPKTEE